MTCGTRRGTSSAGRALALAVILGGSATSAGSIDSVPPDSATAPRFAPTRVSATSFPVLFVQNEGQVKGGAIDFHAPLRDGDLFFHERSFTRTLRSEDASSGWSVRHDVPGAVTGGRWVPDGEPSTRFRWFRGGGIGGGPGVTARTAASFTRLALHDVLPGVDLLCEARPAYFEYAFRVAPGADAAAVGVSWTGAQSVTLLPSGALEIATPLGSWEDAAPRAWQETADGRVPVEAAWLPPRCVGEGKFQTSFALGPVDPRHPLVIDPGFVVFAGYLGGAGVDLATSVADGGLGRVALGGHTTSSETTFPAVVGPFLVPSGQQDGFIAMVDSDGASLLWCGYLGGDGFDIIESIAVDAVDASVVAVGRTTSDEESFPVAVGPSLTYGGGSQDAFVTRVAADGASIAHSGYLGGTSADLARAVTFAADGSILVAGETWSVDGSFPAIGGPDLTHNGGADAFLARISGDGTTVLDSGFIGGAGNEGAYGVARDSTGAIAIVGRVSVGAASFPVVTPGNPGAAGGMDAFFARVAPGHDSLVASGLIGGTVDDGATSVAVDAGNRMLIGGWTRSATLPTVGGPTLVHGGNLDGFVAALSPTGEVEMLGYFGGPLDDEVLGIAADPSGSILIAGYARSPAVPFPVRGGPSTSFGGERDAFVAKIKPAGRGFAFSGFIGGSLREGATAVALASDGAVLVVGEANSLSAVVGPSTQFSGSGDAFVARLDPVDFELVRTLEFTGKIKGALTDSVKPGKDKFAIAAGLLLGEAAGPTPFDPLTEDLRVWAGDAAVPMGVTVPAGSFGWKVKGRKFLWKSAKGVKPKTKLLLDLDKAKFQFATSLAEFAAPATGEAALFLQAGRLDLEYETDWIEKRPGSFKSP